MEPAGGSLPAWLHAYIECLKTNESTLRELNVGGSQIDEAGARAIGNALMYNTTLHVLWLSSNQIGDARRCWLDAIVKCNRTRVLCYALTCAPETRSTHWRWLPARLVARSESLRRALRVVADTESHYV